MTRSRPDPLTASLLPREPVEAIASHVRLLPGFALEVAPLLWQAVQAIAQQAPWRHMVTPGGRRMSVSMTNCGECGWITDAHGYRYSDVDPDSGRPWPSMPLLMKQLAIRAAAAAGFAAFDPDACLLNC